MMVAPLEFEKRVAELEGKLAELHHLSSTDDFDILSEMTRLKAKVEKMLHQIYDKLTPWQKVQVARHVARPNFLNYVEFLIDDFTELAGDRCFGEDKAIIGGLGRFRGQSVMIIGHQKGRDTESRLRHNFGMARPEGYRKARRLMEMAEKFNLPLITLVDTAGAHPGINAEERGQAEAIARCIETSVMLTIPIVATITGEGGSGGAIALAVANHIYMLEHSVYSVISPEGCASILWRTNDKKEVAADALRMTAQDLLKLGIINAIIKEPLGGAHRDSTQSMQAVGDQIEIALRHLIPMSGFERKRQKEEKFLEMGRKALI
jgi:acetyl-CoA carboxylase carboxyl transferase subunit alpha